MKKYVIICETMTRAERLWRNTLNSLYDFSDSVKSFDLYPIHSIETHDGMALYFVCEHYWFNQGGRHGRHDWKPLGENYFRGMLDKWKESNRCSIAKD